MLNWKSFEYENFEWKYLKFGTGLKSLIIFPGGLRKPLGSKELSFPFQNEYTVYSPTYPLSGDLELIAAGINHIMDLEKIDKADIMGSSYGGMMAQVFAVLYPHKIRRIIISNTGTRGFDPSMVKKLTSTLRIMKILPNFLVKKVIFSKFSALFHSMGEKSSEYVQILSEMLKANELGKRQMIHHFSGLINFQKNERFSPQNLQAFENKLLIITAENDPGVLKNGIENFKQIYPHAQYFHFTEGGHFPMVLFPEKYYSIVINFFVP